MRRARVAIAALLALAAAILAPTASAGQQRSLANAPWPAFQHDLLHTGRGAVAGPSILEARWSFQVRGQPGSPVIGADGTIYLPTGNTVTGSPHDLEGYLYAINPDGTLRWRYAFPHANGCVIVPTLTTPAVAADGTIYVHTQSGKTSDGSAFCTAGPSFVHAINPDGTLKWAYQLNDGAAVFSGSDLSSPAIGDDGTVFVTSADTGLYAINPDGTLKWVVSPELTSIGSTPAIAPDGTIYVNIGDLHAYSPAGAHLWEAETGNAVPNDNSPSIGMDGTIYVCGLHPDMCHAVDSNGGIRWSFPLWAETTTPSLGPDGTIYLVDRERGLFALNPDGTERWHTLVDDDGFSEINHSPIVGADGRIYAIEDYSIGDFGDSGVIHVLNPDGTESDAKRIAPLSRGIGERSPAIGADGTLYVPEATEGFDYDPDDQHLVAYTQGVRPPDPLETELRGRKAQRLGKSVKVKASCTNACTATATGKLRVSGGQRFLERAFKLKKDVAQIAAGATEKLALRLPKKGRSVAKQALRQGGKARAKIRVEAEDATGGSSSAKLSVRLKR